jgi:hypothetical protein
MKMFPFSLKDDLILTPFPIHSVILFAIQIRSLYENVSYMSRDKLLYSLARIFTGCSSHREDNDQSTEHSAPNLPHNHIFFELVVVACGSMIDTFCQLGYLTFSEHKTGAMEIRVHDEYQDVAELMIIPTPESLEVMYLPYSTTIHPNSAVSESTLAAKLFPIKAYQVEDQASASNRAI